MPITTTTDAILALITITAVVGGIIGYLTGRLHEKSIAERAGEKEE